jgi:hypothetical protein
MGDLMSNLYWLSESQMERLRPYFPKSRGRVRRIMMGLAEQAPDA